MGPSWVLSLAEDVTVESFDALVLRGPRTQLVMRHLAPGLREALGRLAFPGEPAERLAAAVAATEGNAALAHWFYHLQRLAQRLWLRLAVDVHGQRLVTLVPMTAALPLLAPASPQPATLVLSRFALLRRQGDLLALESPLSCARLLLHDRRAAALLHSLTQPTTLADLEKCNPDLPADSMRGLVTLLLKAGMLGDDADPALRTWEFHDLLFHTRSRAGRHDAALGATYPQLGRLDMPPALKAPMSAEKIELYRPDLDQLTRHDPPLAAVMERRRSLRDYAAEPMSGRQLGEFLYRVARVTRLEEMEVMTPGGPLRMEFASRPYPAGGGLYELEVYAVVHACRELAAGLYHYEPRGHVLERLAAQQADLQALSADAGQATGVKVESMQVLLVLTARVPRVAWKYAGLAYALVLKHVGVVYQTMYLTATAMGLAPCAVGTGDSDLFARAAGVEYYSETSVGEFLLGSKPVVAEPVPPGSG